MTDDLNRLPFLIDLGRKTRAITGQNIAGSILVALIGLTLAATGNLGEGGAAVFFAAMFHFAGDVFVLGNSFRLFRFGEDFLTAEHIAQEAQQARPSSRREGSMSLNATATA